MKRLSIQKLSFLGLVLMAASAVTAAILPSNKNSDARFDVRGSLTASADNVGGVSCTPTAAIDQSCNVTVASGTTAQGGSISNQTTND